MVVNAEIRGGSDWKKCKTKLSRKTINYYVLVHALVESGPVPNDLLRIWMKENNLGMIKWGE